MKELIDALVKAQSEMTHGLATGTNPHFKSEYAPLDEVIKAVKEPLNKNGIFFLQKVYLADNGQCVETEFHGHGAVVKGGKVYVIADKRTPQGYGSALTYAKRYSLQTACGLPTGDDDDGNVAEEEWNITEAKKQTAKKDTVVEEIDMEVAETKVESDNTVEYTNEELVAWKDETVEWLDQAKTDDELVQFYKDNKGKFDGLKKYHNGMHEDLLNNLKKRKETLLGEQKQKESDDKKGDKDNG
jgi:hypothetical protein